MIKPLVSILIPVYNRELFIADCIDSALNQTFSNIEVVVIDNASTDNTWNICKKYEKQDARVRIFRNNENIGPVKNWICCSQKARGKFSKILFSDDLLDPDCISMMLRILEDSDISLVYCAARIGKSQDESVIAYARKDNSKMSPRQFVNLVASNRAPVSPGAILIRTSDLLKNTHIEFDTPTPRDFSKNGAGPDVMISLLTAHEYSYVANISIPLVFFRSHAGSFSIENSNNDVMKGYQSVISQFLKINYGNSRWLDYLAYGWLQQIKFNRKWLNPREHLTEHGGGGSLKEIFDMLSHTFVHVANNFLKKTDPR